MQIRLAAWEVEYRGLSTGATPGKLLVRKFVVAACGFPDPVFINQGLQKAERHPILMLAAAAVS